MSMGFSSEQSHAALRQTGGNAQAATDLLLRQPASPAAEPEGPTVHWTLLVGRNALVIHCPHELADQDPPLRGVALLPQQFDHSSRGPSSSCSCGNVYADRTMVDALLQVSVAQKIKVSANSIERLEAAVAEKLGLDCPINL